MTEPDTPAQAPGEPLTDDQLDELYAERARRADRATRGAMAGVLGLEAVIVLLVPRAIAFTSTGLGVGRTVTLIAFAVVLIVCAGLVRRSFGIALGTAMQVLFTLTGILIGVMFVVGVIFMAIWYALLRIRRDLVGTPGGLRMLVS